MTSELNKNAKIAPPKLAFISHQDVPILKIKKHKNVCKNKLLDDNLDFNTESSMISNGRSPMKMSGVRLPVKGKARNIIIPPNNELKYRSFLFNIIYKYSF
jgi:fructose-1,6-bisphosphatase